MKLTQHPRFITEQDEPDVEYTYNMKYVNGGYSNSIDITPGVGENTGKLFLSINIFGGGESRRLAIPASPTVKKLLAAYQIAIQKDDPSKDKIKAQIDNYYKTVKDTISKHFINAMKELDVKTKQIIIKSLKEINK